MQIAVKTLCGLALAALVRVANAGPFDGPEIAGEWSPLYDGDIIAVHMILMPTGKVLTYEEGGQGAPVVDEIRIWDPLTLELTTPTFPPYDLFCSGHSVLPDGRIFIQGGQDGGDAIGEARATIYDPFTDTWDDTIPKMNAGRWYSTNTILPNGDVLVLNGAIDSYANKNLLPQIWELQSKTWRNLVNAEEAAPMGIDFYPRMFVAPDGRVFKAGPDRDSWFLDTAGTGQWTRGPDMNWNGGGNGFRGYSSTVMFDEGQIMTVGGGEQPPTATAEVINLNDANPQWQYVAPMNHARRHLVATLLADGTVLVTGGTASPGFNNGADSVRIAEIWDPATNVWSEMAPQTNSRVYHSTAVLLPDGRVQIGGGGRPSADGGVDNPNLEIYSPPYLFNGPRPVIIDAPEAVSFAQTFDVEMNNPEAITAVNFIRLGATTHGFNQTQSINKLDFTVTANGLSVTAPQDPNAAQPGYYMLFVLADGVPSVSKMVRFGDAEAPTVPTALISADVTPTTVTLSWNASLDNIAVASYDVYRNGTYVANVEGTTATIDGLLSATPYSFTVSALDLFGNVSDQSAPLVVMTAQPGQNPPNAVAGADQLAAVNVNFTLDGTASNDIDGQLLTYEWSLNGALVGTTPILLEAVTAAGTYIYTLSVSDGALVDTDQVTITVIDAINMLDNGDFEAGLDGWTTAAYQAAAAQFTVENGELHVAIDAEGEAFWTIQLFQALELIEGETYTLDFDARTDLGPRDFALIVEHNGGDYTKYMIEDVTITETQGMQHFTYEWVQGANDDNVKIGFYMGDAGVNDVWFDNVFLRSGVVVNTAPQANAGEDQSGFVDALFTLDGSASQDADNGPAALTYFWSQTAGPVTTLNNDASAAPSFTPSQAGNYVFNLVVNDGELDSTLDEVLVVVGVVPNEQPVARAGTDRLATVGDTIILDGSLSNDVDNGPEALTYLWTLQGGPSATLSATDVASPSFTPAASGSYVFGLVVSDGEVNSVLDTVIITVNDANIAPMANAGADKVAYLGDVIVLDGSNSIDPDSGPLALEFTWDQVSGPIVDLDISVSSAPSFTATEATSYVFSLFVFDGDLVSLVDTVTVDVLPIPNIAPIAYAGNAQAQDLDSIVVLDGGGSFDPDSTSPALSFSWTQLSGPVVTLQNANTVAPSFTAEQEGEYTFGLVVNDGELNSTDRALDASRSLLVTDKAILAQFTMQDVLQKILDDSFDQSQTPADIIVDLANQRQSCDDFNGFPQQDNSNTPDFCSDAGTALDIFEANNNIELSYYQPIALLNRFDLAPADGANCGEYRIAFAGNNIFEPRVNFFIFEAKMPNPNPQLGLEACRPIVDYWERLTHERDVNVRAAALYAFYFEGVEGFDPAIQADHFLGSNNGSGSLRLNARVDQTSNWVFMQFHNETAENCAPTCTFNMRQAPLENVPFPELAGDVAGFPEAQAFQGAVIASLQTPGQQLLADTISSLSIGLPESVYLGRQHSPLTPAESVADFASANFVAAIQDQLDTVGSFLTPENVLNRVHTLSCGGCHNQHTDTLGAPLVLETATQLVEFLSINEEAGPDGQRFTVKPAMLDVFLPEREAIILGFLDQSRVTITVAQVPNVAPVANAGADQTVVVDTQVSLDGTASSDADTGPAALTFSWVQTAGTVVVLANANTATPSFTPDAVGVYGFDLVVNDGEAASVLDSVIINVNAVANVAPVANAGNSQAATVGDAVTLNGAASSDADAGPNALSFSWVQTTGPTVVLANATTVSASFTPASAASYTFELTVSDGEAVASDSVDVVVEALPNVAPVANAGNGQTVTAGDTVTLNGAASSDADAGPNALSFSWVQTAGPAVVLANATSVSASFTPASAASYTFALTVNDGEAASVDSVAIVVEAAANIAPVANAGNSQTVTVGDVATLNGSASNDADAGPNALSFSWAQTAGPTVVLANATTVSASFTPASEASYTFELTVNDGEATSADSVTVLAELNTVLDTDNDGVPDDRDNCVTVGVDVDVNGCALINGVFVEAEDYEGFNDTTAGNEGNAYRNDNVDVEAAADVGAGFNVGWIAAGEWLEYTVNFSQGRYALSTRVASAMATGAYSVLIDGQVVLTDTVGNTGGWQGWVTSNAGEFDVTDGEHVLRINITGGNFNINWFEFIAVDLVVDNDRDGVTDDLDQCLNSAVNAAVDETGCVPISDSDNDGVSDELDQCENTPANTLVDNNGCALPDTDGDGVIDILDLCPNSAPGETVDANGCLVVSDGDNDGIADVNDACPQTPTGDTVDATGCSVVAQQRVEAEDYVNYMDTSAGNSGNAYRADNVDIEAAADAGGGFNIGWTAAGEWLEYNVTLSAGTYALATRVASMPGGGAYTVVIDGELIASDNVGATGGWQGWETHNLGEFTVAAGEHVVRINMSQGAFNLNWLEFTLVE